MEHEYFIYMVASRSRTLYVGVMRNLAARVGQQKDGLVPGFTADYLCTRLVWFERHQSVRNAILREKQIKRWRREKKVWLIERENATWEDLAANWWAMPEPGGEAGREEAGPSTSLRSGRDDKSKGDSAEAKLGRVDSLAEAARVELGGFDDSSRLATSRTSVAHFPPRYS